MLHSVTDMEIPRGIRDYAATKLRGTWLYDVFDKLRNLKRRLLRRFEGEQLLLEQYASRVGKPLNTVDPQLFSEKLYCRMISWNRGHDPIFTQLVDKYAARDYVAKKIGSGHSVRLLWDGTDPSLSLIHI